MLSGTTLVKSEALQQWGSWSFVLFVRKWLWGAGEALGALVAPWQPQDLDLNPQNRSDSSSSFVTWGQTHALLEGLCKPQHSTQSSCRCPGGGVQFWFLPFYPVGGLRPPGQEEHGTASRGLGPFQIPFQTSCFLCALPVRLGRSRTRRLASACRSARTS